MWFLPFCLFVLSVLFLFLDALAILSLLQAGILQ